MKVDYVHKDSTTDENIRKEFSDAIYPTMVIRSQAETIELQENEIKRLNNIISELEKYLEKIIIDGGTRGGMTFWYRQIYDYLQELKGSNDNG